jgi:hypothetical protein
MKTLSTLRFYPRILPCSECGPRCDGGPTAQPPGTEVTIDLICLNGRLLVRTVDAPAWAFCDRADLAKTAG